MARSYDFITIIINYNFMSNKIIKHSLLEVGAAVLYVILIVLLLNNGSRWFGEEDNIVMPMLMLLLLVFSVSFMGVTIFGRSILWYLDGQKKEAVKLIAYKLVALFIVLVLIVGILSILK